MPRFLLSFLLLLVPLSARAEVLFKNFSEVAVVGEVAPEAQAASYALIIANSTYDSEVIPDLPVVENDARAMRKLFEGMGYPAANIKVLENLGRSALEDEVFFFANGLAPEATVVVYYSGHGLTFEGDSQNYIVPVDMQTQVDSSDPTFRSRYFRRKAVPLESAVLDLLKSADPAGVVVFYDACRNAPFAVDPNARKSIGATSSFTPARVEGTAIFYSARRGQESIARLEGDGSDVNLSLYTRVLVSELSANPAIRLRDLHPRLNGRVAAMAMEGTGNRRRQDPSMELELDYSRSERHEFCLASVIRDGRAVCAGTGAVAQPVAQPVVTAPGADAAALEQAFWQDVSRRNTRFHYQQYLQAYPQGRYTTHARAALQTLEAQEQAQAELSDWQAAQGANSVAAYGRFLEAYPDSNLAPLARQYVSALEAEARRRADDDAWADAQAAGSIEGYRAYLAAQPSGRYRSEAAARIEALTPKAPVYPVCYVDDVRPPDAWLSLRTSPTNGATIANMPKGTPMELLGPRSGDWLQVRTQYGQGWVSWKVARWIRC